MAGRPGHPLLDLEEDDLNMIGSFVLASGSIKDLATTYGVSYPTMRQRLDEVISRLRAIVDGKPGDPLNEYLADLIARGQIAPSAAKKIRELHRKSSDSAGDRQQARGR